MGKQGSWRTSPLPANWQSIKQEALIRDGNRCTIIRADGNRCYETEKLECDHIGDPEDHSLDNVRIVCYGHHKSRSGRQGAKMSVLRRFGR